MGIIVRQGLKYSTIAFIGVAIGAFNTIWLNPKLLSPEEIGLLRLVQDNGLFLAGFVQLGAANLANKFFPVFKTADNTNKGFLFFLLVYPLAGFLLFLFAFLLFQDFWLGIYQQNSPAVNQYYYYFIPLILFMMYQLILEAYCQINLRIVVPGIFRDIFLKLFTSGLVVLYFFKVISFHQLVLYLTGFYGLLVIMLLAYLRNLKVLYFKPDFRFLNKPLLREMAVFGAFILLGGAGSLIITKIDTLMLGSMAGTREVAIYTIAFFIGTIIEIPRRAIAQISTPVISQAWAQHNIEKIEEIYHKSAINQLIIGSFFLLGIWCNVDAIFNLVPNGEIYRPGKYVVLFIGLARLFDMATGVNGEIILQSRYYRFNLISVAILAILLVVTNWIFIPLYGINGAAFGTALSVLLYNILKYLFLWIKFRIQPFSIKTIIVLLIAVFTYFSASLVPAPASDFGSTVINILIRSSIITILFASCTFIFQVSEDANHLVRTGYEKLRLFFK